MPWGEPVRVAVDANPAVRPAITGTETYAREVARRLPGLAPELHFTFYASRPGNAGLDLTVLPGHRLWSQARLPIELWRRPPDLLFVPSHAVPFLAPGRTLTVVHDLGFERHPDAYGAADRTYLRLTTAWAERRCRLLIVPSLATARDLAELHGFPTDRVRVIPAGGGEPPARRMPKAEAARRRQRLGVFGPYLLHVGRVEPRKNQSAALAATERLAGPLLVCAGALADRALAARLAGSPRCRLLGRVDSEDLEALYAGAEALVFPSLCEGFGLPVLEAMRRGLPVVTAAVSALPEVGGKAAVYVEDPTDAAALAEAIERARAERERRRRLGRAQAARFTWDRTAARVLEVIRELLA